jgi:hypothetical protein
MRLDDLFPAEYNPRKALKAGDPEYEKLKRSIIEFGLVEPLIWNERFRGWSAGIKGSRSCAIWASKRRMFPSLIWTRAARRR